MLAPFVPGGRSRFARYTTWYWHTVHPGSTDENSVFLGWSTLVLLACAVLGRRPATRLGEWCLLLAVFAVLALGPRLQIFGQEVPGLVLPYGWIETANRHQYRPREHFERHWDTVATLDSYLGFFARMGWTRPACS